MNIVILTKKFGYNFTGATMATHMLIQEWCSNDIVKNIYVLTLNTGKYNQQSKLQIVLCRNNHELKSRAQQFNGKRTAYYSDDHLGYLLSGLPYVHTYHGNWPDARYLNFEYFVKSFYFMNCYKKTIEKARYVVNVSYYMSKFTEKYNTNSVVIRNGVNDNNKNNEEKANNTRQNNKVVMIGNVDNRKYKKLLDILPLLPKEIEIDIYGKIIDKSLYKKISNYPQVNFEGYIPFDKIDIKSYKCLVSVSLMENMPISLVEVLKEGIPVIAIDAGGISEIVNKSNGSIFDKNDISGIASEITLLCKGKKRYQIDAKAIEEYDWNISGNKYIDLFKRIINNRD